MIYLAMYTMPLEDLRALRRHLRHLWVHHPVNVASVYEPLYALYSGTQYVIGARYMLPVPFGGYSRLSDIWL